MATSTEEILRYRQLLQELAGDLTSEDVGELIFLLRLHIKGKKKRSDIKSDATKLLTELEKLNCIGIDNLTLLVEVFELIGRADLKKKIVEKHGHICQVSGPEQKINKFMRILWKFGQKLDSNDLKNAKFILGWNRFKENIESAWQMFEKAFESGDLEENDIESVKKFAEKIKQQESLNSVMQFPRSNNTPGITSTADMSQQVYRYTSGDVTPRKEEQLWPHWPPEQPWPENNLPHYSLYLGINQRPSPSNSQYFPETSVHEDDMSIPPSDSSRSQIDVPNEVKENRSNQNEIKYLRDSGSLEVTSPLLINNPNETVPGIKMYITEDLKDRETPNANQSPCVENLTLGQIVQTEIGSFIGPDDAAPTAIFSHDSRSEGASQLAEQKEASQEICSIEEEMSKLNLSKESNASLNETRDLVISEQVDIPYGQDEQSEERIFGNINQSNNDVTSKSKQDSVEQTSTSDENGHIGNGREGYSSFGTSMFSSSPARTSESGDDANGKQEAVDGKSTESLEGKVGPRLTLQMWKKRLVSCLNNPRSGQIIEVDVEEMRNHCCWDKKIGQGSFGTVYEANIGGKNAGKCVIKQIKIKEDEQYLKSYDREVYHGRILHPFIISIIARAEKVDDISRSPSVVYLMYPNMINGNVYTNIEKEEHGEESEKLLCNEYESNYRIWLRCIYQVAHALDYLHNPGKNSSRRPVYHRDLTSKNILFDENFNVKVCDFGLAVEGKYTSTDASVTTKHISSAYHPRTMDPERYSAFDDVYSFSVANLALKGKNCDTSCKPFCVYCLTDQYNQLVCPRHGSTRPPFGEEEHLHIVTPTEPGRECIMMEDIEKAFNESEKSIREALLNNPDHGDGKRIKNSLFIFYFTGHGDKENGLYLGGKGETINASTEWLKKMLHEKLLVDQILVILDCCHAAEQNFAKEKGNSGFGIHQLSSCDRDQKSICNRGNWTGSYFTHFLCQALRGDNFVSVGDGQSLKQCQDCEQRNREHFKLPCEEFSLSRMDHQSVTLGSVKDFIRRHYEQLKLPMNLKENCSDMDEIHLGYFKPEETSMSIFLKGSKNGETYSFRSAPRSMSDLKKDIVRYIEENQIGCEILDVHEFHKKLNRLATDEMTENLIKETSSLVAIHPRVGKEKQEQTDLKDLWKIRPCGRALEAQIRDSIMGLKNGPVKIIGLDRGMTDSLLENYVDENLTIEKVGTYHCSPTHLY
ncbi:hypothetical protein ACJMK2_039255 [Sinanodonta woodiana]|uniref:Uncharacterized protein n=1 Tax=Sinanodonta woodiana TaxID=1069815 RepID=A0ABD3WDG0_SINWO